MGFFGVASAAGAESVPKIEHCHLNLWTLGGLTGYRVCCLDVGLAISTGEKGLDKIRLGIPAATADTFEHALDSLAPEMSDPTIAGLIFASEEALHDGGLRIGGSDYRILDLDRPSCTMAEKPRDKHFSLWTLRLADSLPANGRGYLRVRFHIRRSGRLWLWQRSLLARNRAIADLRVNDEREALAVRDSSEFANHLLPLGTLDSFVIVPALFTPSVTTPEPTYVRGLEGRIWEGYLRRKTDIRRNQKFLVHRWRAPDQPVTRDKPFRGFLQLERRRSLLPSWSDLMPVIIALLLAAVLFDVELNGLGWVEDVAEAAWDFSVAGIPSPLVGLVPLVAFALAYLRYRDEMRRRVAELRGLGGRADRWLYSFGFRDG